MYASRYKILTPRLVRFQTYVKDSGFLTHVQDPSRLKTLSVTGGSDLERRKGVCTQISLPVRSIRALCMPFCFGPVQQVGLLGSNRKMAQPLDYLTRA